MRILTFRGETPADALKKAQLEVGEEAMLIETREIQKKSHEKNALYEIVVGVDDDVIKNAKSKIMDSLIKRGGREENDEIFQEFFILQEENEKLTKNVYDLKEQVLVYQSKSDQIENIIIRLKESGKLTDDELKELYASDDEIERIKSLRDDEIEEEKATITEAIFQITDSMKSLKASMILYISLLIGSSVIAILLVISLLYGIFFSPSIDPLKINGLMANYLAFASPSVLKIVLLVIVLRFINNILKLRENLLVETGYIEKVSGVLKAGMLMSDYSRSMIEAREIFKKVINQLIKKDNSLDKDKVKEEDDSMAMSIAEKTVSMMTKSIKQ
ncbi:hypothetical protein [Sulfuricurvum sp.]|uniref:hypothetical protein n=1 Tax=Sulfuricurvum sp. TaxID=2025608 RepID=UPI003BB5F430